MKVLIYSGVFLSLTTAVYAGDMLGDRLLKILAEVQKPTQTPSENFNLDNPLGHAKIDHRVREASSVLVGDDSTELPEGNILGEVNILDDATTASPVLNELGKQESLEDQNFGVLSGTGQNEDESTRYKTDLDSTLSKVKPEAKVLDKANPNSAAAA